MGEGRWILNWRASEHHEQRVMWMYYCGGGGRDGGAVGALTTRDVNVVLWSLWGEDDEGR